MAICFIMGASPEGGAIEKKEGDLLIAADGGYAKVPPGTCDLVMGDFDSLPKRPTDVDIRSFPVRKDDTDMLLAVREGLSRGYHEFVLYGSLGGNLDHTIANIQTLAYLKEHGARGVLQGEKEVVALLENETVHLRPNGNCRISVFSYGGKAEGVTLKHLEYEAENMDLSDAFPLGVSNHFTGKEAVISVHKGRLLLIYEGAYTQFVR
jgi:thiamine pyrophosphokinase